MAFRGVKPAIQAYKVFQATVKAVDKVVDDMTGKVRYYKVTTTAGVVNLGPNGVDALKDRYDFDVIQDIVGAELDFQYRPNNDTRYSAFQLSFVLGRVVEGIAESNSEQETVFEGLEVKPI